MVMRLLLQRDAEDGSGVTSQGYGDGHAGLEHDAQRGAREQLGGLGTGKRGEREVVEGVLGDGDAEGCRRGGEVDDDEQELSLGLAEEGVVVPGVEVWRVGVDVHQVEEPPLPQGRTLVAQREQAGIEAAQGQAFPLLCPLSSVFRPLSFKILVVIQNGQLCLGGRFLFWRTGAGEGFSLSVNFGRCGGLGLLLFLPSSPLAYGRYGAVVEDGCLAVYSAETLGLHAPLAQFLPEVDEQGTGVHAGGDYHGRQRVEPVAADEVGGQAHLVVVFQKVQHVWPRVAQSLPASGNVGGRLPAAEDGNERVVEAYLVVEIVKAALLDEFLIAPGLVDLADEEQRGVFLLHLRHHPLPESHGHEFRHIAAEAVHTPCCPEEENVTHLVPRVAALVVQLGRVAPVTVVDMPWVVILVSEWLLLSHVAGGRVVRHEVHDEPEPTCVGAPDKGVELPEPLPGMDGKVGGDVVPVAHGIGRACLPLDGGGAVGRTVAEGVVGEGGMVGQACVPDVGSTQRADLLQGFFVEVSQLAAAVDGCAASWRAMGIVITEQAGQHLIDNGAHSANYG